MPLKLWLPLDGNSDNEGISGTVMSGSPASWGNGPTGKCATFNNNAAQRITSSTAEFNYTVEDFSWCCWINKDSSTLGTDRDMWAFTVGRADAGSRGYGLRVYQRSSGHSTIHVLFGSGQWGLTGIADGSWHHVAFTRKGSAIKVYLDGVLKTSANFTGTLPTYTEGAGVGLGLFFYSGGNIYPLIGSISDFRIYNHALSDREVYQISQALLVHFPLCSPDNAQANLLTWSSNYTETTPLVKTSASKDGITIFGAPSLITVTPGKAYYIQVKSDGVLATHDTSGGAVTTKFTLWLYVRNQGTTKAVGDYDNPVNLYVNNAYLKDSSRQLYVWKWTATSNAQDITLRVNTYSDGTTATTVRFWDFKVEEGAYTPYVPSANQAQYAALGYGSGIVRDATGRRHDLNVSGAPIYAAGSARYSTAIDFNQAGYLYNNSVPLTMTQFTVAFWMNPHTNASSQHFMFGTFDNWPNNGIGMYRDTNKQTYSIIVRADAESTYCSCGGHSWTLNTWSHFAITWDGTTVKVYQNAELKTTKTYGLSGNCLFKNIYLGNSMFNTHPASETDEASMSDFRIYGTALSAADVKYLYETSASIDNTGTVFADGFDETELRASVGKSGVFVGSGVSESGGNQCVYSNLNLTTFDPNRTTWSYTPAANTNNSCMDFGLFSVILGIAKYHIKMKFEWSGFDDILTTNPDFTINFHGPNYLIGSTSYEWNTNYISNALYAQKQLQSLITGAASGVYYYDTEFTLPSSWLSTYDRCYVGFRTNYSNGTGKITASKLYIYPADEHCDGLASLADSGAIRGRLVDEVELA